MVYFDGPWEPKADAFLPAPPRRYMVFAVENGQPGLRPSASRGAYSQPSDQRLSHRSPAALTLVLQIETMTEANQLPKRAELESAIRRWIDDSVWRQEIKRAETGGLDFLESHEVEKMGREDARELDGLFRYASNMFAPQAKAAITRVLTGGTPDELQRSLITEAARQNGHHNRS
jgi:hypothetical protein